MARGTKMRTRRVALTNQSRAGALSHAIALGRGASRYAKPRGARRADQYRDASMVAGGPWLAAPLRPMRRLQRKPALIAIGHVISRRRSRSPQFGASSVSSAATGSRPVAL